MAVKCTCGGSQGHNFGTPNCTGEIDAAARLGFTPTIANDGTYNSIKIADVVNDAYIKALINNVDKSKRLSPTGDIKAVDDTRAEFNTFAIDNFDYVYDQGNKTYTFTVIDGASPQMAAAYNSIGCSKMSFYSFSTSGQIVGNGSTDGELRPFRIEPKTMQAIYKAKNDANKEPAQVLVQFTLAKTEDDADIAYMNYGTGANDVQVNILDYNGLIDVELGTATNITATGFTSNLTYIYGSVFNKTAFKGAVAGDFVLTNTTTGLPVVVAVTEISDGVYEYTIPAQTAGDILVPVLSKEGYDQYNSISITAV